MTLMKINSKLEVIKRTTEVFGDENKGLLWLNTFNASLDDIPINILNNKDGIQKIIDVLGRIEHGIFI